MSTIETATFVDRNVCINCTGGSLVEMAGGKYDEGVLKRFIDADPWGEDPAPFLKGQQWSYVTCQDCGQAFHRSILSPEWNERRFSKWMSQEAISEFEKSFKTPADDFRKATEYTSHVLQIEQLTRTIRGAERIRLLDFGCGYGGFLTMCSMFGFDAVGVDRSSAKRDNGSFAKVFAEIEEVAGLAPFHALTLFEVLEHLDDPRELMLRLRELLMPGGILILETPDCSGVRNIATLDDYRKIHPLEHINGFTPETLKHFAERMGFVAIKKPVGCVTCDSTQIVKKVAKRILAPLTKPTTQQYFKKL